MPFSSLSDDFRRKAQDGGIVGLPGICCLSANVKQSKSQKNLRCSLILFGGITRLYSELTRIGREMMAGVVRFRRSVN